MKGLVKTLIFLLIIYFGLTVFLKVSQKGFENKYQINKKVSVEEKYVKKENKYYVNIGYSGMDFYYEIPNKFKKKMFIIDNVEVYHDDNYTCIYPTFINRNYQLDVMCKKNGINYHYRDLFKENSSLDEFVEGLDDYDINNWKNDLEFTKEDNVYLYEDNIVNEHYTGVSSYKGLYLINKNNKFKNIQIFNNDIYDNRNSIFFDKYYLVTNYNDEYEFDEFYLVNLLDGSKKTIKSYDNDLSFDLVFQGYVDNYYYIFDKDNLKQYKINNNGIELVANKKIKYFDNNKWVQDYYSKFENLEFNINNYDSDDKYIRIDNYNDYYYYFEKVNDSYNVYRSYTRKKDDLIFIFNTSEIKNLIYIDDYIYYLDTNTIRYYNDLTGVRSLLVNKEFEFNDTLKFSVYKK